jgi:hypothetical protein
MTWILIHAGKIFETTGVGEAIEIHEAFDFRFVDQPPNDIRSDETSAAAHQQIHVSAEKAEKLKR